MKKFILDFTIVENRHLSGLYSLLILSPVEGALPEVCPGQFVQVSVDNSKTTFLRRPISINHVDYKNNQLWLLVRKAGDGTAAMIAKQPGELVNLLLPLGNSFTMPEKGKKVLLIGGGVGVAPLL